MSEASKVVCIVGPTASGKSSLAEAVALRLKSAVVSVDAMQVYRGMDVGTAKTPPGERRGPLLLVAYEDLLAERGPEGLHALLAERDPRSAELIHPNNSRRVVRALEMLDEGVSYAQKHEGLKRRCPHYAASIWALSMSRNRLYQRIDLRVEHMKEQALHK